MSDLSLVITLVFLAATLAIYGLYWFFVFNRREQSILNRRLQLSKNLSSPSIVFEALRQERGLRNVDNPFLRQLSDWLTQTGINVRDKTLPFLILCIVLALLFSELMGFGAAALVFAVVVSVVVAALYLYWQRSRRIMTFGEQMPDAIDIITRGVRVGLPFSTAIGLVAREMPDPIGTEFGMLADEVSFGLDLRSALDNLYRRVGQDDLVFLTVAVTIQTQTGGNLGEILTRLSKLMRSRGKMRLKIKALSAEGRLSGWVLSAVPILLFLIINFISPAYYAGIRGNALVVPAVILVVLLLLIGNIVIYRMVHFKF